MSKRRSLTKVIGLLVLAVFLTQTTACGYFIHPERRGQTGGRIDPVVALLDGACLLLFIIPGIIAFAVDFSAGTIYLPSGHASLDAQKVDVVKVNPKDINDAVLEQIVQEQTGLSINVKSATTRELGPEAWPR